MASFQITGKLKAVKDKENFKGFEVRDFPASGWQTTKLRFNVISGNNSFMVEIAGGKFTDDAKNKVIYTNSRPVNGDKSKSIQVDWKKRHDPATIKSVAGWRIYSVDLLDANTRERMEAGTDEEIETAKTMKREYLEKTEFAEFIRDVIANPDYQNAMFTIKGNVDFSYSAEKGEYYRTLSVDKINREADNAEPKAEMTLDAYYTADSIVRDSYDETKKYLFNCYTDYYFSNVKAKRFVPIGLVIDGSESDTIAKSWANKFSKFEDDATVRKASLVCTMLNGSQTQKITYDDLDDETKEDIGLGLITLEDAIRGLGGNMFGDRVTETRVRTYMTKRGNSKSTEPTAYSEDDLKIPPIPVSEAGTSADEDEDDI